jgi:cholesterol transport system auxiliary component
MTTLALRAIALAAAAALAGCAGVAPDKPARATLYDFGPGAVATESTTPAQGAIVLADIEASAALESSALLYRLGYADAHQLHPYANARWSAPPPQLVRQRLREQLGRDRVVLDASESAALARSGGAMPRVLRIDLEEFTHVFDSPSQSWGVLRLRATLLENTPSGERLLAQRGIVQRQPAPTPDASGGAHALAAAADAAARDISDWLAQAR